MNPPSSPPRVVALLTPLPAILKVKLEAAGYAVADATGDSESSLLSITQFAVARGASTVNAKTFSRLPQLRLLCCWGAGYDGVDLHAASELGIAVANSPGANSAAVADLAIGHLISLLRGVPAAQRHLREGHWKDAAVRLAPSPGLTGTRLGIFGYGEVGQRVAARAQALEMQVGCFSRRAPDAVGVQAFPTLLSLAAWADALVVAVSADASTHHAVDAKILDALGPQGHLINMARGSIVDESALCHVLDNGQLAGFASDVFENEPHVPAAMLNFPNAVLTPHVGGATLQGQIAMAAAVLSNLAHYEATGHALHRVDPSARHRPAGSARPA